MVLRIFLSIGCDLANRCSIQYSRNGFSRKRWCFAQKCLSNKAISETSALKEKTISAFFGVTGSPEIYPRLVVQLLSRVQLFCDPMDCSPPSFSVHGISQGGILSWLSFSSPGDVPQLGIKLTSPALASRFFTTESPGKPHGRQVAMFISIAREPWQKI